MGTVKHSVCVLFCMKRYRQKKWTICLGYGIYQNGIYRQRFMPVFKMYNVGELKNFEKSKYQRQQYYVAFQTELFSIISFISKVYSEHFVDEVRKCFQLYCGHVGTRFKLSFFKPTTLSNIWSQLFFNLQIWNSIKSFHI